MSCMFCRIIDKSVPAQIVLEDDLSLAFLDHRPLFPGHCLLVPKTHHDTLADVPNGLLGPLFHRAQLLARAMEEGLGAEGSFVGINNRVSQSVPHLHIHVVPRRKKDGLKGFFWPRHAYGDPAEMAAVRDTLVTTLARLQGGAESARAS